MKSCFVHIRLIILLAIFMAGGSVVCAQNTPDESTTESEIVIPDSANFVQASLMIAEPYFEYPQTVYGHTFLRMQCPSENLDLCFSIESGDYEGFLDICLGNYPNRLTLIPTDEYIQSFDKEGRIVTEYPLNITLHDGQRLWELLDSICMSGLLPYHDFFHHGCSQELIRFLDWGLNGTIVYGENAEQLGNTLFKLNSKNLPSNNWIRLFLAMYATTDAYRIMAPDEKTVMPCITATVLSDAQIRDGEGRLRPLLKDVPPIVYQPKAHFERHSTPPLYVWFALLLGMVVVISFVRLFVDTRFARGLAKTMDCLLFTGYNGIALTMLLVCVFSVMPTLHGWNWNFLIYNLIPLVVWIYGRCRTLSDQVWRGIYMGYAIWLCLFMAAMYVVGNHFLTEQYLLASVFAARCLFKSLEYKSK